MKMAQHGMLLSGVALAALMSAGAGFSQTVAPVQPGQGRSQFPAPVAPEQGAENRSLGVDAHGKETCFCKISKDNLTGVPSATGVLLDLTANANLSFSGLQPKHSDRENSCASKCTAVAAPSTGSQSIATGACAANAPNGTAIVAYSAVGSGSQLNGGHYNSAQNIGTLTNTPPVWEARCPAGWAANPTGVDGGVTSDGKCKKLSGHVSITPFPANGTPLGSYGFYWGPDAIIAWGNTSNGGQPVSTMITPAACHL